MPGLFLGVGGSMVSLPLSLPVLPMSLTSNFDWFTGLSLSFLNGQSNYFGFGFTTLD